MTRQRLTLFSTFLLFIVVVASDGWASSFQLSRVADLNTPIPAGSGTFTSLGPPAVSGASVAFRGSGNGQEGIYLFNGAVLSRVADLNTPIPGGSGTFTSLGPPFLGPPALSGARVAFRGGGNGQEGIYLFNGAVLSRVADLNTRIPDGSRNFDFDFFGQPALSDGIVAFSGGSVNGQEGIYLFNGTVLSRVADLNTRIPGGSGNFTPDTFASGAPPLLSGGNVAFLGTGSSGQQGIYLYAGGVIVRVADGNTLIPGANVNFFAFESPALSGDNVAFLGTDLSLGHAGIYLFESGVLRRVADANTPIPGGSGNFRVTDASYPALSERYVAALGLGSSGQQGIYLYEGGVLGRVADRSTPIPGGSGNFNTFLPPALSGGNVAFLGTDQSFGQTGIYLFEGGVLNRMADRNTPIPGGSGNFTDASSPALSGTNVAFLGFGSSLQKGIYLATATVAAPANEDFNGDGKADILWRHSSGVLYIWFMNGNVHSNDGSPGSVASDWTIAGIGDFNDDGKADILWRYSSGIVYLWLMEGTNVIGAGSPGGVSPDWTIVGVGDFNGDGKADILWRHSSGVVYVWLMDGTSVIGTGSPGSVASDWTIAGVGDFNGDGKADILWRHTSGVLYTWFMNGTTRSSGGSPGGVAPDWTVAGVGDFNGDGKADILWRHSSGIVYLWLMDGTSLLGAGSPGAAGPDWSIQGTLDFNGDGKADILWRHSSGVVYIWLMNGPSILDTGSPGGADSSWTIQ
jgi:VCBS repeat protein/FG-GAP repeat protein